MEFAENLIASLAEFPGVIIQTLAIEKLGRKKLQALMMILAAVSVIPLVIPTLPQFLGLFLCFIARMFSIAAFQTAWVFAPESYPTSVRTTGMGTANTIGKSASLLSPLMSTYLYDWAKWAPVIVICLGAFIGSVCAMLLPFDTANRGMDDGVGGSSKNGNMATPLTHEPQAVPTVPPEALEQQIVENTPDEPQPSVQMTVMATSAVTVDTTSSASETEMYSAVDGDAGAGNITADHMAPIASSSTGSLPGVSGVAPVVSPSKSELKKAERATLHSALLPNEADNTDPTDQSGAILI